MVDLFRLLLICFFLLSGSVATCRAAPQNLSEEDEKELDQLLLALDKHTAIATKTKMNADYIPGMVTVLYGTDLEARGKRNIMEALTLVPGIDVNLGSDGTPSLVSRGIGSPYISATSMILLNGTPLNTTLFGFATGGCNMPIEQIERIEIIRGPGAALYGEFAYSGVINIITRGYFYAIQPVADDHPEGALACQYRFLDRRQRAADDPRDDRKGYDKVDLTLSYFPTRLEGLTLRVGVQNVFNQDIRTPSAILIILSPRSAPGGRTARINFKKNDFYAPTKTCQKYRHDRPAPANQGFIEFRCLRL